MLRRYQFLQCAWPLARLSLISIRLDFLSLGQVVVTDGTVAEGTAEARETGMSDSIIFEFGGHKVRTAGTPEAPLFCAADVCAVLGLTNAAKSCERLDQDEVHEVASKQPIITSGAVAGNGGRKALYITESGLFALVLTSTKPEARGFRKWVTSEVLPEIRRRGVYSMADAMARRQLIQECFRGLPAQLFNPLIDALRPFVQLLRKSQTAFARTREAVARKESQPASVNFQILDLACPYFASG